MMPKQALVQRRIETARRRLEAAQLLLGKGYTNDALSKAYYAIFAAAKAALATKGLESKKHAGVIGLFNRHFVKTGLLDKNLSKILAAARDARELGDYSDFFDASAEETAAQIEAAARFIEAVSGFLESHGTDLKD